MTTPQTTITEGKGQKNKDHGKETETVSIATIATSRRLVGDRVDWSVGNCLCFYNRNKTLSTGSILFSYLYVRALQLDAYTKSCIICQSVAFRQPVEN